MARNKKGEGLPAQQAVPVAALVPLSEIEGVVSKLSDPSAIQQLMESAKAIARSPATLRKLAELKGIEDVAYVRRQALETALWTGIRLGELLPKGRGGRGKTFQSLKGFPHSTRNYLRQLAKARQSCAQYLSECRESGLDPTQKGLIEFKEKGKRPDSTKRDPKPKKPRREDATWAGFDPNAPDEPDPTVDLGTDPKEVGQLEEIPREKRTPAQDTVVLLERLILAVGAKRSRRLPARELSFLEDVIKHLVAARESAGEWLRLAQETPKPDRKKGLARLQGLFPGRPNL